MGMERLVPSVEQLCKSRMTVAPVRQEKSTQSATMAKTHYYVFKNITDGGQIILIRANIPSRILMKTKGLPRCFRFSAYPPRVSQKKKKSGKSRGLSEKCCVSREPSQTTERSQSTKDPSIREQT